MKLSTAIWQSPLTMRHHYVALGTEGPEWKHMMWIIQTCSEHPGLLEFSQGKRIRLPGWVNHFSWQMCKIQHKRSHISTITPNGRGCSNTAYKLIYYVQFTINMWHKVHVELHIHTVGWPFVLINILVWKIAGPLMVSSNYTLSVKTPGATPNWICTCDMNPDSSLLLNSRFSCFDWQWPFSDSMSDILRPDNHDHYQP